ncbi:MAG: ABC transporter permease [Candidatus Omnitrophota bacterium]|nr:MAG: ABC transporter permease [Candidatus Omnitrophota bacterium]RKY34212.1 MAG: ABC transporter permease [Candidatus Omnitrophota bacterium]RKY43184.1 MAG: ABC transporter permease [Candidatus Omnitrophota bacterium]
MLRKAVSFLKRDFYVFSSYKLSLLLNLLTILASITTFFFISKLIGKGAETYLKEFGGDYFSFVLIGLAFGGYLSAGLNSFSQLISYEQSEGTLEILLLSPTKISTILILGSLGNFLFTSLRILAYLFLGWLIFGFSLGKINLIASLIILILSIISFSSLGVISASFILVFKRADPLTWLLSGLSKLLGGVYYPVKIMPSLLQRLSFLLPITYSLRALRKSIILGASLKEVIPELTALSLFCLVLLPLSILSFKLALKVAKKKGSLLYS